MTLHSITSSEEALTSQDIAYLTMEKSFDKPKYHELLRAIQLVLITIIMIDAKKLSSTGNCTPHKFSWRD